MAIRLNRVVRTFFPVGQGGFCVERHKIKDQFFNLIYDCGNRGNRKPAMSIVRNAFNDNEQIDILFISHLDTDHVSLIRELAPFKNQRIVRVVLPLLQYQEQLDLFVGYTNSLWRSKDDSADVLKILLCPEDFFKGAKIVYVRPDRDDEDARVFSDVSSTDGQYELNRRQLDRYEIVNSLQNVRGTNDWLLLPVNVNFESLHKKLIRKIRLWLHSVGGTMSDLNDVTFVRKHIRKLRLFYKELPGGTNGNSMTLYSGPDPNSLSQFKVRFSSKIPGCPPGCLYTGDATLTTMHLNREYRPFLKQVGIVQVPHHGAKNKFEIEYFPAAGRVCPVFYGEHNIHRHPCECVVRQIRERRGVVVPVTDNPRTKIEQTIEW